MTTESGQRRYFPFIDGLRGLAAMYVVGMHIIKPYFDDGTVTSFDRVILGWLVPFGHEAVVLFIVISGFCIGAPFAAGKRTSVKQFGMRRAKRILPPYYVAVAMYVIALLVSSNGLAALRGQPGSGWGSNFAPGNLITHLALIHNWFPEWRIALVGPMWSTATEVQIYLVFILVLVPIWNRFGFGAAMALAWLLGLVPFLWRSIDQLWFCCPWFLGAFMLGVAAVRLYISRPTDSRPLPRMLTWFTWCLLAGCVASNIWSLIPEKVLWARDCLWAIAFTLVIVTLNEAARTSTRRGPLLAVLESRVALWLGAISYTVYLQHSTVLMKMRPLIGTAKLSGSPEMWLVLIVGIALILPFSWVLWWLVERPSMLWRDRRTERPSAPALARVEHAEPA